MSSFDFEVAAALRELEQDIRERVSRWLASLEDAGAAPAAGPRLQLQPVHFTCRIPAAYLKDQTVVVPMPQWRVEGASVEVATETYAAAADGPDLAREGGELAWTRLDEGCAGEPVSATVAAGVPRLRCLPTEMRWQVPTLSMNPASLQLELPVRTGDMNELDAAAQSALQRELTCGGRAAQARLANAVARLFRKALQELLNLKAATLGRIDAVLTASVHAVPAGEASALRAYLKGAREAAAAAFAREVEVLERQAVRLVADAIEGLTPRIVDVSDGPELHMLVVPLRRRAFDPLRLRVSSTDARVPALASSAWDAAKPFDPDVPDHSATPLQSPTGRSQ